MPPRVNCFQSIKESNFNVAIKSSMWIGYAQAALNTRPITDIEPVLNIYYITR